MLDHWKFANLPALLLTVISSCSLGIAHAQSTRGLTHQAWVFSPLYLAG